VPGVLIPTVEKACDPEVSIHRAAAFAHNRGNHVSYSFCVHSWQDLPDFYENLCSRARILQNRGCIEISRQGGNPYLEDGPLRRRACSALGSKVP